ncbi:MAG: hypothetical protein PUE83_11275 [Lachnobacterium sp.]|nr:hypothetical protein [Lachnobacterium sp.]
MEENLQQKQSEMHALHKEVHALFIEKNIKGALKNEYNNKLAQYDNMYSSLEAMKSQMTDQAAESLINHQLTILSQRMEFEREMKEKFEAY